jgi:hypothetical protein
MPQDENSKRFDLEDRTYAFAKRCRSFIQTLAKSIGNVEDARQLVRSSGSIGANHIEANEERDALVQEAQELMNIFGAIVRKSE